MKTYKGTPMEVHPEFKELCEYIREERIVNRTDRLKDKMSLVAVSKTITNMINSNKDTLLKKIIEVKYKNGKN